MSRRPFALLSLTLLTLLLSACADVAPTAPERQIKPSAQPSNDMCPGGYATSSGKC